MTLKDELRLNQILTNETILTPNQQFKTLLLDDNDFISFNELCDISRQETLNKLYALRDLCNIDKPDYNIIKGIAYSEKIRPVLTLLFSRDATSRYVSETFEIPTSQIEEEETSEENENDKNKENKKSRKKQTEIVPAYSIDYDTLNRLLTTKKTSSKIDEYLITKQKDLLELYKEYLDTEIFYPDFHTIDSTGNVEISSKHENYIAIGKNDSIIIPEGFGKINMQCHGKMIIGFNHTYDPNTEKTTNSSNELVDLNFANRVFIHKALLPRNYSKTQK